MSDDAKKKPGSDPERLVIRDDPGEALDRLLGKHQPNSWEWAEHVPGRQYQPGIYDVEIVEEGESAKRRVELTGNPSQRDDGRPISPYARILRVRRVA